MAEVLGWEEKHASDSLVISETHDTGDSWWSMAGNVAGAVAGGLASGVVSGVSELGKDMAAESGFEGGEGYRQRKRTERAVRDANR